MRRESGDRWVTVATGVEVATGLVLIILPSFAARLLFGAGLTEPGQALGRFTGIALISLALACSEGRWALRALLVFSVATTVYLAYLGAGGATVGILLWPAVALHAALTVLLIRTWFASAR
jgi:hypothetical protein